MKLKVLQSDGTNFREVEGQLITPHFALYDDYQKGRRTFRISHIPSGRTICRRTFAMPDVAENLCLMFEDAFGNILDKSENGILKKDIAENPTIQKHLAYQTSLMLEELDQPINFSKLVKAKNQAVRFGKEE